MLQLKDVAFVLFSFYGASIQNKTFPPQPAQIKENVDSIHQVTDFSGFF